MGVIMFYVRPLGTGWWGWLMDISIFQSQELCCQPVGIIIISTLDSRTWLTHPPTDNNIIHPRTQDSANGYNRYFEPGGDH
jgi:hypothetical protein